jgi:hypothetical protein
MDQTTNRTEAELPEGSEKFTPAFQHLAPAIAANDPAFIAALGGDTVTAFVPKMFQLTLSDGTRRVVKFPAGTYPIPAKLRNHYYLKANGVKLGDERVEQKKPQLEEPLNDGAADKAKALADAVAAEKAAADAKAKAVNGGKKKSDPPKDLNLPSTEELAGMSFAQLGTVFSERNLDSSSYKDKDSRIAALEELHAKADDAKKE